MSSFAGVQATRTGAYDPNGTGNNVIRATLATQTQAVCGTGSLAHVGRFKVKARVWATSLDVRVRLSYRAGDGRYGATAAGYVAPPCEDAFAEVDLGEVSISPAVIGAQSWEGRIEAYSDTVGDTLDIDYITLIPVAEGYGKARGAYVYQPGSLVVRDDFTGTTAGGALNGRAAPAGGAWATSGSTTDFTFADGPETGDETITRATTSDASGIPRIALLGSTATNQEVGVRYRGNAAPTAPGDPSWHHGAVARYVDASNYVRIVHQSTTIATNIWVEIVIAGNRSFLGMMSATETINTWFTLRLIVWDTGYGVAALLDGNGNKLEAVAFQHAALATGGVLASGKAGIIDMNASATASTRFFDDFYAATPAAEELVINSLRSVAFRHDGCLRSDAAGSAYGKPWYRGDRVLIPQAGYQDRDSRIFVKARRNDVDVTTDPDIADLTLVNLIYVPRYRMPGTP